MTAPSAPASPDGCPASVTEGVKNLPEPHLDAPPQSQEFIDKLTRDFVTDEAAANMERAVEILDRLEAAQKKLAQRSRLLDRAPDRGDVENLRAAEREMAAAQRELTEEKRLWEVVRGDFDLSAKGVKGAQPTIDYSVLATRKDLIEAFGKFTGMTTTWFDNVTNVPALASARKVRGHGQRGKTQEPWFCPFEVMEWLISPKRRMGRSVSPEKAWELLERKFPKVHAAHSIGDPREV